MIFLLIWPENVVEDRSNHVNFSFFFRLKKSWVCLEKLIFNLKDEV